MLQNYDNSCFGTNNFCFIFITLSYVSHAWHGIITMGDHPTILRQWFLHYCIGLRGIPITLFLVIRVKSTVVTECYDTVLTQNTRYHVCMYTVA